MTRLLLIGAAGMDWAGFDSLARAGALPRMAALRERGVAGWLGGAPPDDGPAAWASIVTGLQPESHGVWRDQEAWPGGLRPTGKASWRAAPIWARLALAGVTTGSVAWPAAGPGSDWSGLHIDERFAVASARSAEDWALPRHCAPDSVREMIRDRRVHPAAITAAMIRPLAPHLGRIDLSRDQVLPALAAGMARAATIQAAAVWMLERGEETPDAMFLHQRWLGRIRSGMERRSEPHYSEIVPGAWRFLDGLIGHLADLAGPEAVVMVVSPGWRSSPGLMLAAGGGIQPDRAFAGASLLDIAPTVLGAFGLEDPSLPGRKLPLGPSEGPLAPAPSPRIETPAKPDPLMVYALRKHGYRPPPRPSPAWKAQGLAELARMMLERDPAGAGKAAAAALRANPGNVLALRIRVRAHIALEEPDALPALGDLLIQAAPDRGWGSLAHGAYHVMRREPALAAPWLRRAEADPDVGCLLTVAAVWLAASRMAHAARVFQAVLVKDPDNVSALIGKAMAATARRDFMSAETDLQRAVKLEPGRVAAWLQLAQVYARSGRKPEAKRIAGMARHLGAPEAMAVAAGAGRLRG